MIAISTPIAVHPRACGEHGQEATSESFRRGSSPRLRGTPQRILMGQKANRFIPAPAGNTACCHPRCSRGSVHPRACGEHLVVAGVLSASNGSSPRLRGTQRSFLEFIVSLRFIPAPAGNTVVMLLLLNWLPVHPRACGEHGIDCTTVVTRDGSSPRLRGTPANAPTHSLY